MKNQSELRARLRAIDHKGYPAYKELRGSYDFGEYVLHIDHVQGDPFAAPSSVSVSVDAAQAAFPPAFLAPAWRRTALEDHLVRLFRREAEKYSGKARGSGKSGLIGVSRPGQEVLSRSACAVSPGGDVDFRTEIGFPANGRTINAGELAKILFDFLPACVRAALYYRSLDGKRLRQVIELADDQAWIRAELEKRGLCAFVADGAVLPRASGVSDLPMRGAVPFVSPDSLRVELDLPHAGKKTGMGIRRGITLIAGGGYHGKSTLLHALERGVYNHIAGDGREYVITDETAMKIRAEDGRSIVCDDISLFISNLPGGKDTVRFSSENASGSTSQAAAVVEAAEAGARLLLIDEDTSATNFMVRDALMQQVIAPDKEPITPFIDRARLLFEKNGISTILALGSSGAWFFPADCILQMDEYRPLDITQKAKAAAEAYGKDTGSLTGPGAGGKSPEKELPMHSTGSPEEAAPICDAGSPEKAVPQRGGEAGSSAAPGTAPQGSRETEELPRRLQSAGGERKALPVLRRVPLADRAFSADRIKTRTMGLDGFSVDRRTVDLRYVEQLVDPEQSACLAQCLLYAERHLMDGRRTLSGIAEELVRLLGEKGAAGPAQGSYVRMGYAVPRKAEICAMLSRFRGLRVK